MNGGFYTIELEETAIPFNKGSLRTVPEPCMEKLKTELELQLGLGLIEQVPASKKSEWLHPIVVAPKKDGSIRLCVDLRSLYNQTRMLEKSGFAAAMLMFRNTPRSPTDLSPAQLVFGRHLQDTLPFSRQMLHPQCRFEIEKRRLEVREGQRQKNDASKR
jgi:hypothetical protein